MDDMLFCISTMILIIFNIYAIDYVCDNWVKPVKELPEPPKDYLLECFEELELKWCSTDPVQMWLYEADKRLQEEYRPRKYLEPIGPKYFVNGNEVSKAFYDVYHNRMKELAAAAPSILKGY